MKKFARTLPRSDRPNPGIISVNNCGRYRSLGQDDFIRRSDDRNDHQIIYVNRGSVTVDLNGKSMLADDHCIIHIPKNTPHSYTYKAGADTDYYWLHFAGTYADEVLEQMDFSDPIRLKKSCRISEIMNDIIRELQLRNEMYTVTCAGKMLCMLADIKRYTETPLSGSKDVILNIAADMKSSYAKNIPISAYAYKADIELHYFIRLFGEIIGTSPLHYIHQLRINAAADLLISTKLTVAEIAEKVGFNSPMYFSRVFKKNMHISPTEYRKSLY